jgi:hypothetical protein
VPLLATLAQVGALPDGDLREAVSAELLALLQEGRVAVSAAGHLWLLDDHEAAFHGGEAPATGQRDVDGSAGSLMDTQQRKLRSVLQRMLPHTPAGSTARVSAVGQDSGEVSGSKGHVTPARLDNRLLLADDMCSGEELGEVPAEESVGTAV